MSRLIDADKLKRKVYHEWIRDSKEIDRVVDSVSTIDAVEVVRCKDCIFAVKRNTHANGRRNYMCYKYSMFNNVCGKTITYEILVDDNHYCAYGERKDNDRLYKKS